MVFEQGPASTSLSQICNKQVSAIERRSSGGLVCSHWRSMATSSRGAQRDVPMENDFSCNTPKAR
jgi:hypothetical protein